jgi:hypothetical protein
MGQQVLSYFWLWSPGAMGSKPDKDDEKSRTLFWNVALYVSVAIGVLGQMYFQSLEASETVFLSATSVLRGFFVAAVILPAIYKAASLHRRRPSFINLFICVQHGYFWPSLLSGVSAAVT